MLARAAEDLTGEVSAVHFPHANDNYNTQDNV